MTTGTHQNARYPHRLPRFLRSRANMLATNVIVLGLRVAQFTFAFVMLALTSYIVNWYNADVMTMAPAQVGWLLFSSIFTIISVVLLEGIPKFAPRFFHPYAALSMEFSNALFYFSGFIALSTFMSKLLYCRGSVCGAARADVAFGIFQFLLWGTSTVIASKDVFKKIIVRRSKNTQAPLGAPPMKEAPAP
ncbi:membrane-associating domain-containing protein [Xylaria bambusicola]|uniref:membrane-associating domain-containing protein n=1 Tax=Xylaria bambusicola TaxID=326684 RepID=UPI0020082F9A|nr:membrane-associating domain-containing protein [Xylaria bambusicola]KAI0506613.1 membrane-associating domain-containing protein [Xylaria bambusicola]